MLKLFFILFVMLQSVLSDVSYYELLGVSKQASTQDIKQAYKKLAVKLHPDKNPNANEQKRFLEITEAYETLKDPQKRHQYDLYGSQQSYTKKYDYHSQAEYNNLYYNGLYHDDPFVETLSGKSFHTYLDNGLYFINFYSPFCPPCQNLADKWKRLAEIYKGIIKVGAVNCKYYNSFCFNTMRIGSYPTLLFYPNGKQGNYLYYRGAHAFEALEDFVIKNIRNKVDVPTIAHIRNIDKPMVYILDDSLDENMLVRIAYHLKGLASVAMAAHIHPRLSTNIDTVIVFKYKNINKEIQSTDEKSILSEIVDMLPKIENIGLEKLQKIRNDLRAGKDKPWVIYFTKGDDDKLLLQQMKVNLPDMNVGEINCEDLSELCHSLQVEEVPAWAVLKVGGAYQRFYATPTHRALQDAATAKPLHTLSVTDFNRICEGDMNAWVLIVIPYQVVWDHYEEPFTQACLELVGVDINFGIMSCTLNTDSHCRLVAHNEPTILLQNGTDRHIYSGDVDKDQIVEFVNLIKETADVELSAAQAQAAQAAPRARAWLLAYAPAACARACRRLLQQWRQVARRLRPLDFVRVGALDCAKHEGGFCNNVRTPTARIYPLGSGHHYTVSLQNLNEAPYILEWALEHLDDSILKLNWQSFTKTVIADELNPSRNKKPWLVYFHSPRCYRCYEMFPDFAIVAIKLGKHIQFGKVNCITERSLCQHEHINSYPSIKLYLNRNKQNTVSRVVPFQPKHYLELIRDIKPHLRGYNEELFSDIDSIDIKSHVNFRDEL